MITKKQKIFISLMFLTGIYCSYDIIINQLNSSNKTISYSSKNYTNEYNQPTITDNLNISDLSNKLIDIEEQLIKNKNKIDELSTNNLNFNQQLSSAQKKYKENNQINIFNGLSWYDIIGLYNNFNTKKENATLFQKEIHDINLNIDNNNKLIKHYENENEILSKEEENTKIIIKDFQSSNPDNTIFDEVADNLESKSINDIKKNTIDNFIDTHPTISNDSPSNNNYQGNIVNGLPNFIMPVHGVLTSNFGYRYHPISGNRTFHSGIDIGVDTGTPVLASNYGLVVYSGWYDGFGNAVILSHAEGVYTLYGHNSQLLVHTGDIVTQGQTIALAGSTGYSTGSHCHFSLWINNTLVNPLDYIQS